MYWQVARYRIVSILFASLAAFGIGAGEVQARGCCDGSGSILQSTSLLMPTSSTTFLAPVTTSYVVPTSSVFIPTTRVFATSSLLTTSYVVPTTFVRPTQYVVRPTSFIVPTARTYLVPTTRTYLVPTTSWQVTSSSSACCDSSPMIAVSDPCGGISSDPCGTVTSSAVVSAGETIVSSSDSVVSSPSTGEQVITPLPSTPRESTPSPSSSARDDEPPLNPNVLRSEPMKNPAEEPVASPPAQPAQPVNETPSLVEPPADADLVIPPATDLTNPPVAPPAEEMREVQRPALDDPSTRLLAIARGALDGKIVSAVTGAPEVGVNVVVVDAMGRFRDRTATSDDAGRFQIVLPEGDWTIRVPKSNESSEAITREITVSGGLITDTGNRPVSTLTINR